jgi:predicted metalloendopeptidase
MKTGLFSRITAVSMALTLVLPLWGCGSNSTSDLSVVDNETVLSNEESIVGVDEVKKYPITDNGIPIWDFDEYVNSEWLKELEDSDKVLAYKFDDIIELENSRLYDILNDDSLYNLSADDPLYKTKYIYDQFYSEGVNDSLNESLLEFIAPIEEVSSLDELYDLYLNKEYAAFNDEIYYSIYGGDEANNLIYFEPKYYNDYFNLYNTFIANPSDDELWTIYQNMEKLGISQERFLEMLSNAIRINQYAKDFAASYDNGHNYQYFFKDTLEQNNVKVPLFECFEVVTESDLSMPIVSTDNLIDYLNEVFTQDNLEALKDTFILNIIFDTSYLNSDWEWYDDERYDNAFYYLTNFSSDNLAIEYQNRFFDEEKLKEIRQFVFSVKTQAQAVVRDFEWLSEKSMETAIRKIVLMKPSYGVSDHIYDLSDVEITDDLFNNFVKIKQSRRGFYYSQAFYNEEERGTYFQNNFVVNAFYNGSLNNITLTTGLITVLLESDMSYEEKIALLGMTVAHEISHSFGPRFICFEGDGYYWNWMTEEEYNEYDDRIRRIIQFFDGKETDYFDPINGAYYVDETYADLMAMEICLRILSEQDNIDYDLFFTSYASRRATYYTEEGAALLNGDNHLPAKFRINYILGQFDKFYEVYKIDEKSPFYVPNLERLKIFK